MTSEAQKQAAARYHRKFEKVINLRLSAQQLDALEQQRLPGDTLTNTIRRLCGLDRT